MGLSWLCAHMSIMPWPGCPVAAPDLVPVLPLAPGARATRTLRPLPVGLRPLLPAWHILAIPDKE